ncbi:MAG: FHA domain-containing protein [Planctomycetota bacterium]
MTGITIKVLHGADRGLVYEDLTPPMTIGREEGNDIQLNDERVSRCHLKIQQDNDRVVLTDLDSTNGTKVNGNECQLKILRHGDLVSVGRTLLLIGSEEQIAARLAAMGGNSSGALVQPSRGDEDGRALDPSEGSPVPSPADSLMAEELPSVPDDLTPGQKAQLCEILDYVQRRLERLVETAVAEEEDEVIRLKQASWQKLLDVQARLSVLNRRITDPQWP